MSVHARREKGKTTNKRKKQMREKYDTNRNRKQILGRPPLDFEENLDGAVSKLCQDCQVCVIVLYQQDDDDDDGDPRKWHEHEELCPFKSAYETRDHVC